MALKSVNWLILSILLWRRRDSNPRPEQGRHASSTCLVVFKLSGTNQVDNKPN